MLHHVQSHIVLTGQGFAWSTQAGMLVAARHASSATKAVHIAHVSDYAANTPYIVHASDIYCCWKGGWPQGWLKDSRSIASCLEVLDRHYVRQDHDLMASL